MATPTHICEMCQRFTLRGSRGDYVKSNRIASRKNDYSGCALLTKVIEAFSGWDWRDDFDPITDILILPGRYDESPSPCYFTVCLIAGGQELTSLVTSIECQISLLSCSTCVDIWWFLPADT